MNLAILIGVSSYRNLDNLPGCKNDVEFVEEIVKATGKFSDCLYLKDDSDTESVTIKEKLTTFIAKYKDQSIEELFFYFTGHGEYTEQDFYYISTDYENSKRRQTSIENSELDVMLKTLKPGILIKIVDACQSGVQYIKNKDSIKNYLEKTTGGFLKCYFMFSSHFDQSSYHYSVN